MEEHDLGHLEIEADFSRLLRHLLERLVIIVLRPCCNKKEINRDCSPLQAVLRLYRDV